MPTQQMKRAQKQQQAPTLLWVHAAVFDSIRPTPFDGVPRIQQSPAVRIDLLTSRAVASNKTENSSVAVDLPLQRYFIVSKERCIYKEIS